MEKDKKLLKNALTLIRGEFVVTSGGKGSGNFGHLGRPGLVGGSSAKGAGGYSVKSLSSSAEEKVATEKGKEPRQDDNSRIKALSDDEFERERSNAVNKNLTDALNALDSIEKLNISDEQKALKRAELRDLEKINMDELRLNTVKQNNAFNAAFKIINIGTSKSGNYGHAGRPGMVGGSAARGASGGADNKPSKTSRTPSEGTKKYPNEKVKMNIPTERGELYIIKGKQWIIGDNDDGSKFYVSEDGGNSLDKNIKELFDKEDFRMYKYAANQDEAYSKRLKTRDDRNFRDDSKFAKENGLKTIDGKVEGLDALSGNVWNEAKEARNGNITDRAKKISEVISKSNIGAQKLYRGISGEFAKKVADLKVGDTFTDDGFSYASSNFKTAGQYGSGSVILNISIPDKKGYAVDLGYSGHDAAGSFDSYLIDKGMTYEVLGKKNNVIFIAPRKIKVKNSIDINMINMAYALVMNKGTSASGNWGHAGRPGMVGGSAVRGHGRAVASTDRKKEDHRSAKKLAEKATQEKKAEKSTKVDERNSALLKRVREYVDNYDGVGGKDAALDNALAQNGLRQSASDYENTYEINGKQWSPVGVYTKNGLKDGVYDQYAISADGEFKSYTELGLRDDNYSREHRMKQELPPVKDHDLFTRNNKLGKLSDAEEGELAFTDDLQRICSDMRRDTLDEYRKRTADAFKSMISRSESNKQTVYRGVNGDFAQKIKSLKVGDTFTDSAFSFTSRNLSVANSFSESWSYGEPMGVILNVSVPGGKGWGVNMDGATVYGNQAQFLMAPGLEFEVTGKKGNVVFVTAKKPKNENSLRVLLTALDIVRNHNPYHDRATGRFTSRGAGSAVMGTHVIAQPSEHKVGLKGRPDSELDKIPVSIMGKKVTVGQLKSLIKHPKASGQYYEDTFTGFVNRRLERGVTEDSGKKTVEYFKKKIKAGEDIEPITTQRSSDGKLAILDGNHRAQAFYETGRKIPYIVKKRRSDGYK